MKIILTHLYFIEEDELEKSIMKPYPPLGILYLSAYLKKHSVDVEIFDSTFSTYADLISSLEEKKPDAVGIYCNMVTKLNVLKLIKYCNNSGITTILGGPDASTQVDEFLNYGADVVVSGEGEEALLSIVATLSQKNKHHLYDISNVSYKDESGNIRKNEKKQSKLALDDLPYPDYAGIDFDKYLNTWEKHHGIRSISLITARGCAFTCRWCSHSVFGWTHRRRNPKNVISELMELIERYKPTQIWFADDVFSISRNWLMKFNGLLKQNNIKITFECLSRADSLDEDRIAILKDMGCYRIWFGSESGSQRILDAMGRKVTKEEITNITKLCQKHGIEAGLFVMFGYPGEGISDIYETINYISNLQPDRYLTTIVYPLLGTLMYEDIKDKIICNKDWDSYLQRELDLKGRFTKELYSLSINKLGLDYRIKSLAKQGKDPLKRAYLTAKSIATDIKIRRLSGMRTG